jgi:hypothetical protein
VSDDIRDDVDTSVDESVDSSDETSADSAVDSSRDVVVDDASPESLDTAPSARATDEGLLIALTAIRMAVKNRIIVGALRDQKQYLPESYVDVARDEIASLALQNDVLAARLEDQARTRAKRLADRAALVAENNARTAERDARAAEKAAKTAARGGKRGVKLARRPRTSAPVVLDVAAVPDAAAASSTDSRTTDSVVVPTPPTAAEQTRLAESQRSEMLRRVYTTLAADLRCVAHNSERLAELVESARQDAWQEIRGAWHVKLAAQSPVEVGPDYDRHREGRLLELVYIDLAALRHDAKRRSRKSK